MGRVVDTLDIPVTKTTGGLLAIPKDHPLLRQKSSSLDLRMIMSVCCQCSMCTQMCPRNALGLNVQPHKAMRSLAGGMDLMGDFNGIFSCCNCGLCTYYACNFGLKPSQVMQTLKSAIASKGTRPRKEVFGPVDGGLENKKVPVSRLIARLGLSEYDVPAPMVDKALTTGPRPHCVADGRGRAERTGGCRWRQGAQEPVGRGYRGEKTGRQDARQHLRYRYGDHR